MLITPPSPAGAELPGDVQELPAQDGHGRAPARLRRGGGRRQEQQAQEQGPPVRAHGGAVLPLRHQDGVAHGAPHPQPQVSTTHTHTHTLTHIQTHTQITTRTHTHTHTNLYAFFVESFNAPTLLFFACFLLFLMLRSIGDGGLI